jgi:hypothetical protein
MTSITTYTPIAPTRLYIKQHSITKKKYFGKTIRKDPLKYLGSGKYWKDHINKYGKEFVETIWLSDLYYDTSISEHALHFSYENNIVNSDNWANLIPENGLDSFPCTTKSEETKTKKSAARTGKKDSEETKTKKSAARTGKKHSEETRLKIGIGNLGKTMPTETKARLSAAQINKTPEEKLVTKQKKADSVANKTSDEKKDIQIKRRKTIEENKKLNILSLL